MNAINFDQHFDRRSALRLGGLSISAAALLAACGGSDTEFGTVGEPADLPVAPSPDGKFDDGVLLRTAASLHYSAMSAIDKAVAVGGIDAALVAAATAYKPVLQAQADKLGELTTAEGATPWTKGNPKLDETVLKRAFELVGASKTAGADAGRLVHALIEVAASTHQFFASLFVKPELRQAAMQIGLTHARTAATLAGLISPDNLVSAGDVTSAAPPAPVAPSTTSAQDIAEPDEPTTTAAPANSGPADVEIYMVPATFGQLGATNVTLGNIETTEDDKRQVVGINTLYLNSLIYTTMS